MENLVVILPIQKIEKTFEVFLNEINETIGDYQVIIVNDGCFSSLNEIPARYKEKIHIVHHAVSLGMGQAIKSGINHYLVNNKQDQSGLIVVNRNDGVVFSEDIDQMTDHFNENPDHLIWGYSESNEQINFVLRNAIFLFGAMNGFSIEHLQSSIFTIPGNMLIPVLYLTENGDDFVLDVLSVAGKMKCGISEVQTCLESQKYDYSTKKILKDSLRQIFVFMRFSFTSIITAAIDMAVFSLIYFLSHNILFSIIISRITAGTFQFISGKHIVFRSKNNYRKELIKYILLVATLMMLSYGVLTPMVIYLRITPYFAKILSEVLIFILSFAAQRLFVFSADSHGENTDWDQYYKNTPKTTSITRRITERILVDLMKNNQPENMKNICEFGGGNSSFFPAIRKSFPDVMYTVVDNNQYGLNLFLKNNQDDKLIKGIVGDILSPEEYIPQSDIVYSVGLIEHFTPEDTKRAIKEHFNVCRPGGIVILTFPTPTWLYQVARSIANFWGLWHFHDERPLSFTEVIEIVKEFGDVKESLINWPIVFTQGVVLIKANEVIANKVKSEF